MNINNLDNWQSKERFEILYKKYFEPLCAYVFGVVKDYDTSEEVVQNLFVKLWEKRKHIPINTSIKSYLYQAAKNAALNHINHLHVKDKYKQYYKNIIVPNEHNSSNPAEESDLSNSIQQAIENLPEKRKEIFLLSRHSGLKNKEIAEKLNISIKTVESQMGKALSSLRTELTEYLPAIIIAIILGIK